jgi:tripartite-type tricarboxylate transporter receptor subunit TctC
MVAIPYKGTGQAVIDLLAGHVQFFCISPPVAMPHVKSGKLRGLAVTSTTRNPALPDMPTVAESGLPGYEAITWHSIVVPAKTPKPIVKRLNTELVKIVNLPDTKERFLAQGLTPVGSTPEQLGALIKEESIMYAKLVKQIGLEPQ